MESNNFIINSKNERTLKKFLTLLFKRNDLYRIHKFLDIKVQQKLSSVLTSPHVNKIAQEQFEFKLLKKKVEYVSTYNFAFLVFVKNVVNNIFADVNVSFNLTINQKSFNRKFIETFNPSNPSFKNGKFFLSKKPNLYNLLNFRQQRFFCENLFQNFWSREHKKTLRIWDVFGESLIRRFFNRKVV